MFRHPNYYKELRKRALDERNRDLHVRPISGSVDSATNQAISPMSDGSPRRRSPGSSSKQQAASHKHQASSSLSNKPQASSPKQQASSSKPQASSSKI